MGKECVGEGYNCMKVNLDVYVSCQLVINNEMLFFTEDNWKQKN